MKYRVDFYYKGTSKEQRYPVYTSCMVYALAAVMSAGPFVETEIVRI